MSVESTQVVETAKTAGYRGQAHVLDRQVLKCPEENQLINRIRLLSSTYELWYSLTCIQLAPGFVISGSAAKDSATFDMGGLSTFGFDQVELGCGSGTEVQYLLSARLIMNYNTNPYSAAFALQCGRIE